MIIYPGKEWDQFKTISDNRCEIRKYCQTSGTGFMNRDSSYQSVIIYLFLGQIGTVCHGVRPVVITHISLRHVRTV